MDRPCELSVLLMKIMDTKSWHFFDVNPKLIGISVRGVKVLDTDELENFIKTHGIKIAALTIPKDQAPAIAKKMAEWELKDSGILHRSIFIYQIMLQ